MAYKELYEVEIESNKGVGEDSDKSYAFIDDSNANELFGNDENDMFFFDAAAAGATKAFGGEGADTFVFSTKDFNAGGVVIKDFNVADGDKIGFSTTAGVSLDSIKVYQLDDASVGVCTGTTVGAFVFVRDGETAELRKVGNAGSAGTKVLDLAGIDGKITKDSFVLVSHKVAAGAITAVSGKPTYGTHGDDTLTGSTGGDVLYGLGGNDTLGGKGGADTMFGGDGDDVYEVDTAGDKVIEEKGFGTDTVKSKVNFDLAKNGDNVENLTLTGTSAKEGLGNALNNKITAANNASLLKGEAGDDTLIGGTAKDTLFGGVGKDDLQGGVEADQLFGDAGDDKLAGGAGDDTLDGGAGADNMAGDAGNDTYIVDDKDDVVKENSGEGDKDVVVAKIEDYTLVAEVEGLTLGEGILKGSGNAAANVIKGNDANNVITGGGGADSLAGGKGDDIYIISGANAKISEESHEGVDTVKTSVDYSLDANIEKGISIAEADDVTINGNAMDNTLTGSSYNDTLNGGEGNDTVRGGKGNDVVTGGKGHDQLFGGAGDDSITGHEGKDVLTGGAGEDVLSGGDGDDILRGGEDKDQLKGGKGSDMLSAGKGDDQLEGEDGNDKLFGRLGDDELSGGSGNDTYFIDSVGDTIIEDNNSGTDIVFSGINYKLSENIENLTLTGSAIKAEGNDADNILIGNHTNNELIGGSGNDRLIGNEGEDTLSGGIGEDIFVFNDLNDADVISDFNINEDKIELDSSVFTSLTANMKNLSDYILQTEVNGELLLSYDQNGTGDINSAVHFATLTSSTELDPTHFIIG